jgi:phosphomannomutase
MNRNDDQGHKTGRLMISVAGIRGVVGDSLTPDVVASYAAAFGTFLGRGRVVLGRDSRLSGPILEMAAEAGLRSSGCDVVKLGIVPTPTVQLMVKLLKARGGIAVTASHNPPQWNALKFIGRGGEFLDRETGREFLGLHGEGRIEYAPYDKLGMASDHQGAVSQHVERILALPFIPIAKIRKKKFKVVVDTCHGAGGPIFQELLDRLGCKTLSLHPETTGDFSRPIEPLARNLSELEAAVKKLRADAGFATDADVDRLSIVTEKGKAIGEECTLALAASWRLANKRGLVVTNLSTSRMVDDIAAKLGGRVLRTAVGEANVVAAMKKGRAVLGGEGNGGVIVPELQHARDASAAMAMIMGMMAESGGKLSKLASGLPAYHMVKETFPCETPAVAVKKVAVFFHDRPQDHTDGVKIFFDHGWLHVRGSGTEPIVRAIAESADPKQAYLLAKKAGELAVKVQNNGG